MPIWVACVARAHIDRAGGAVTVEKDRDVEAPRASGFALAVSFQQIVHPVLTEETEVAEASDSEGKPDEHA